MDKKINENDFKEKDFLDKLMSIDSIYPNETNELYIEYKKHNLKTALCSSFGYLQAHSWFSPKQQIL